MRKKPWANDMISQRTDCVIDDPASLAGKWKETFGFGELIVEIGAGKGDYWISMGNNNPEQLWVAVEKDHSAAGLALKKSIDQTGKNMKFIVADAAEIGSWFGEGEVDRIHLNFSDPWPKRSHRKRRLTHEGFLNEYRRILVSGGTIVMKTDNAQLFEYSLLSFGDNGWKLQEVSVDYRRQQHPEDAITEYENRFMELGQPIYRGIWAAEKE